IFPRRIQRYDSDEWHDVDPVSRGLAAAYRRGAVELNSRPDLVCGQDRVLFVRILMGARDRAALSLRPAHAAGLESVPAVVVDLGGADRRRPGDVRLGAARLTSG